VGSLLDVIRRYLGLEPNLWIHGLKMGLVNKLAYARKVLPGAMWRGLRSSVAGPVHLIFVLADHFEPAIDAQDGRKRVSRFEQERRVDGGAANIPRSRPVEG